MINIRSIKRGWSAAAMASTAAQTFSASGRAPPRPGPHHLADTARDGRPNLDNRELIPRCKLIAGSCRARLVVCARPWRAGRARFCVTAIETRCRCFRLDAAQDLRLDYPGETADALYDDGDGPTSDQCVGRRCTTDRALMARSEHDQAMSL